MTLSDIEQKIKEIESAIQAKDYEITYESANNIKECDAPDGSTYLLVYDMDDARSSTYFGSNTIYIAGEEFTCELEFGEWSSEYFDQIRTEYGGDDDEDLIEVIQDILSEIDDFLVGEYTDLDSQVEAYQVMNHCTVEEYYWYEDNDRPMDYDD